MTAGLSSTSPIHLAGIDIRLARSTSGDVNAIVNLGRTTFEATFSWQVSSEDLSAYLDEAYTFGAISDAIRDPTRQVFIAEIISPGAQPTAEVHGGQLREGHEGERTTAIAGFLSVSFTPPTYSCLADLPNPLELRSIYIDPAYHGSGLARLFMDEAKGIARDGGYESMWLGVYPGNPKAIRFYEKSGMKKVGTHEFRMGNQVDTDDVMAMRL